MNNLVKWLFISNGILTLPFGILSLAIPANIFLTYGITLDAGGELIARGYGATLVGYGFIFLFLRNTSDVSLVKTLLKASLLFNLIEAVIQVMAYTDGIVASIIWGTILVHAIISLLTAIALIRYSTAITSE